MALWQARLWNRLATSPPRHVGTGVALGAAVLISGLGGVVGGMTAWLGIAVICAGAMIAGGLVAVAAQCHRIAASLDEVSGRLDGVKATLEARSASASECPTAEAEIDLARFGRGDPAKLVAGRVEARAPAGFPRLVPFLDPDEGNAPPESDGQARRDSAEEARPRLTGRPPAAADLPFSGAGRLLATWDAVVERGDLATCRAIYATLAELVDGPTLRRLGRELQQLADGCERSMRDEFAECHRLGDVAGMLAVGRRICAMLPDRLVAEEFRRIEPRLRERIVLHKPGKEPGLRMGP